jgi:hypothetical protein
LFELNGGQMTLVRFDNHNHLTLEIFPYTKSQVASEKATGLPAKFFRKSGQRKLRTEAYSQPNLFAVQRLKDISPQALDALIKYGNNKEGWSALSYAITYAHDWEAAEALIESGIGINTIDSTSGRFAPFTPIVRLIELAGHGHPPYRENGSRLLRKIIEKGIDVSLPIKEGLNQGQFILRETGFLNKNHLNNELDIFLSKYKIDLNFRSQLGHDPVYRTLESRNIEGLTILLKHGIKINDMDCLGHLHLSSSASKDRENIHFLIENGANPFIASDFNPQITSIDRLLEKIMKFTNEYHESYKREMIPYLMSLGAQIR